MSNSILIFPLTKRKFGTVDEIDRPIVEKYRWHAANFNGKWYAKRSFPKGKTIYLHRVILNALDSLIVDHINGDGLDNRRCNLRLTDKSGNVFHSAPIKNGTSIHKGIYFNRALKKWHARIRCHGIRYHLGYFKSENEAAQAYNEKALVFFGEFAWLNKGLD